MNETTETTETKAPEGAVSAAARPRMEGVLSEIPVRLSVELGRGSTTVGMLSELAKGSVVELEEEAGSPLCVYANGRLVARGEAVLVNDRFGVRLTEILR